MEVFISINGVLRNLIQKIEYHYNDYYLNSEVMIDGDVEPDDFEYGINTPIRNDILLNYFKFHSIEEFYEFLYIEFPVEIFGHAGLSYPNVISDINTFIYDNKDINITLVGVDELGKSRPATLFFLSKNACLMNNIKFIRSDDVYKEWDICDVWITDDKYIIDKCPVDKKVIKFNTIYNDYFDCELTINKLTEIDKLWLKSSEKNTTSI